MYSLTEIICCTAILVTASACEYLLHRDASTARGIENRFWPAIEIGAGVAVVITLIASKGSIQDASVILLGLLGFVFFSDGFRRLGVIRFQAMQAARTFSSLAIIGGMMQLLSWWVELPLPQMVPKPVSSPGSPIVTPSSDVVLNEMKETLEELKSNAAGQARKKSGPPFAVEIDCVILTPTPKDTANGFWIGYNGPEGLTRSPAQVTVHIRLTNLQSVPAMISRYSIKMGEWKMVRISNSQTDVFFSGCANSSLACWLDDDHVFDKQLVGLNLKPRTPIQGWTLLEYPADSTPDRVDPSKLNELKFWVSLTDVEGSSFTSRPLQIKSDAANESVQVRELSFARGKVDLNKYKYRDYYKPLI